MRRPLPPLWLAVPSRFAAASRRFTWLTLMLFAAALVIASFAAAQPDPQASASAIDGAASDGSIYDGVIDGLRAGGNYYDLTAQALRTTGFPLDPLMAFRLPVHAVVQAALPPAATVALLYLLAIAVAGAWWIRMRGAVTRSRVRIALAVLVAAGVAAFVVRQPVGGQEGWAALLAALALALRTPARWTVSVALGLIAMLVCPIAALLPVVMAYAAWRDGVRREVAGWVLALLGFALAMLAHARGVADMAGPLDPTLPPAWWLDGAAARVAALTAQTALGDLPTALTVPIFALALLGWAAWRDPIAERALMLIAGWFVATMLFTRPDGFAWAAMPAPFLLIGLIAAPDALRDLGAVLLDRRRVRVQRISQ